MVSKEPAKEPRHSCLQNTRGQDQEQTDRLLPEETYQACKIPGTAWFTTMEEINMLSYLKNNRLVYFAYFIRRARWATLRKNFSHTCKKGQQNGFRLVLDMLSTSLRLGFSFDEFFYYGLCTKTIEERRQYASIVDMYKFQLMNNPKNDRFLVENKIHFLSMTKAPLGRRWLDLSNCSPDDVEEFVSKEDKVVLKNSQGGAGKAVKILSFPPFKREEVFAFAKTNHFDLLEGYVKQHYSLARLHPASLNTIRVITQVTKSGSVEVLGCALRMGVGIITDNLSTGGIACPIDLETGKVKGPGVSFDMTKGPFEAHPTSGETLEGMLIPYWNEIIQLCRETAVAFLPNRSVGWDVAVTEAGPVLIEGNHDWGARLLQMPHNRGFKETLSRYSA